MLHRGTDPGIPDRFDLVLYEHRLPRAENAFTYDAYDPARTVKEILAAVASARGNPICDIVSSIRSL